MARKIPQSNRVGAKRQKDLFSPRNWRPQPSQATGGTAPTDLVFTFRGKLRTHPLLSLNYQFPNFPSAAPLPELPKWLPSPRKVKEAVVHSFKSHLLVRLRVQTKAVSIYSTTMVTELGL